MSWAITAVVAVSATTSMVGSMQQTNAAGDSAQDSAKNMGISNAQTKASAARVRGAAPAKVTAVNDNMTNAIADVRLQQELAESRVRVQAAAAGVSGDSVESVVQETKANEGRAIGSIDQQAEQAFQNLRQERIDLSLEEDANMIKADFKSSRGLQNLAIAGTMGAIQGGMSAASIKGGK